MHCSDSNSDCCPVQPISGGGLRNFIICLTHANFIFFFLLQVSISVLQVTQESISGTTSHTRIHITTTSHVCASEHAMKLKVHMIKSLSPFSTKLYHKNHLLLLALLLVLQETVW